MKTTTRIYDEFLREHLGAHRQMALVTGPRQVGKTTTCAGLAETVLNWDNDTDRAVILKGSAALESLAGLDRLRETPPVLLLDELHKFPRWKQFLKGFFDKNAERSKIIVTGSSRMDTYRRVGDSLMGRYFLYHMHPLSVAETVTTELPDFKKILREPQAPPEEDFVALWEHGGFPEPFLKRDSRFSLRWQRLRHQQLVSEDLRDLTQIQQLDQLAHLVGMLYSHSGQQLVYSRLAQEVRVSVDTVRRWVDTLANLHHGFLLRPWFRNVSRSLRKEPKWYLRDWSAIDDAGCRAETFVACHLLKAVDGWNDLGLGTFQLAYLRDKEQREVDFVVVKDGTPWFLAEVKKNHAPLSPSLHHYQKQIGAPFAFQLVLDTPFVDKNPFENPGPPLAVPARTLLSQLI